MLQVSTLGLLLIAARTACKTLAATFTMAGEVKIRLLNSYFAEILSLIRLLVDAAIFDRF